MLAQSGLPVILSIDTAFLKIGNYVVYASKPGAVVDARTKEKTHFLLLQGI
ncbi:hypothetical protein [Phyllobacterium zundukense]|uniref:hypothetical protein n=1 Tax=Phyllobacterium zundukense TaxID=1867719 RepID=UPI0012FFFB59|nr:hypothetical protein [Phyllobacterium zundukense]